MLSEYFVNKARAKPEVDVGRPWVCCVASLPSSCPTTAMYSSAAVSPPRSSITSRSPRPIASATSSRLINSPLTSPHLASPRPPTRRRAKNRCTRHPKRKAPSPPGSHQRQQGVEGVEVQGAWYHTYQRPPQPSVQMQQLIEQFSGSRGRPGNPPPKMQELIHQFSGKDKKGGRGASQPGYQEDMVTFFWGGGG